MTFNICRLYQERKAFAEYIQLEQANIAWQKRINEVISDISKKTVVS